MRVENRNQTPLVSVIIPAYNEEKMIPLTSETVGNVLKAASISYEIIFVNDGSTDGTWEKIVQAHEENRAVKGLCFSKNFGKEAAIMGGLAEASGQCAVVMDCDLQNPPELIPEMVAYWKEGFDIVEGVKRSRGKEGRLYAALSRLFNRIMSTSVGVDMSRASDFKLLDQKVIAVLVNIRERNMFFRATTSLLGFRQKQVEFDVRDRMEGERKWTRMQLIRYALTNITSYTNVPIKIFFYLGILMTILVIAVGGEALIQFFSGRALGGFTTVILLQLIIGAITSLGLGILGYYISRIFDEVRIQPKYVIQERTDGLEGKWQKKE